MAYTPTVDESKCVGCEECVEVCPVEVFEMQNEKSVPVNADECSGCETCLERCQMEAVWLDDGKVVLDTDRCIGCGLCVTTCPTESLSLRRKPETAYPAVPKDLVDTSIKLGQARGKLTTGGMVGMVVKSKVDRLLAPR